MFPVKNSLV